MTTSTPPRPIPPTTDLRSMLIDHILDRSLHLLDRAEERRRTAFQNGEWREYGQTIRSHVQQAFGDMPFGDSGGPLNTHPVSSFDTPHCRIENILFESFPGWQVNASVFVPRSDGPFPAVVIPVGHSGKQYANYQIPARAFAALGFLAILFDPPGQDSEKKPGNDHFRDGVRTFLTSRSSSRYFVLDALRCIDYLESRDDVDLRNGVGMTGVSGGGHTTLFATLFDERITCQGPSCCINRMADHPVGDLYAPCPESMWSGRLRAGVDELDLLLAAIPTPTLYMAGEKDEVFKIDCSRDLAAQTADCYRLVGAEERFRFFVDSSGHAYTLAQVEQFAAWMNRWLLDRPDRVVPHLDEADFPMLPYDQLNCHPAPEENIYTLNRAIARQQAAQRPATRTPAELRTAVRTVVGTPAAIARWQQTDPFQVWSQTSRELLIDAENLEIPATLLEPMPEYDRDDAPYLLYIDEDGRSSALESSGPAAQLSRMLQRDAQLRYPHILLPDLPGWGDTTPALVPYSMAGWASMDRLVAYFSCTMGDGILAIRTRIAAALINHLTDQHHIDPRRIVIAGNGLGGTVALMAAALCDHQLGGTVNISALSSFQLLTETEQYTWPAAAFLPDALEHFDLPELVRQLPGPVHILNPLNAEKQPLDTTTIKDIFHPVPESVQIVPNSSTDQIIAIIQDLLDTVGQ